LLKPIYEKHPNQDPVMITKSQLSQLDPLSRRQFVANAAKTALGVSVLPLFAGKAVAAEPGKAKHCIFLYMSGGMTHMDTFDPKPGAETQGKTGVAKTPVAGINLSEFMPKLAKGFKDIALIRSMTQKTGDHRGAMSCAPVIRHARPFGTPRWGPGHSVFSARAKACNCPTALPSEPVVSIRAPDSSVRP